MKLATIFITSGREVESEITLRSFARYNGWGAHAPFDTIWLHGDDVSSLSSPRLNSMQAQEYGYETVIETKKRLGAHEMRKRMIDKAIERGATHIFVLENDWETVREIPWAAIVEAFRMPNVWAFRMYWKEKQADGTRPCGDRHAGRNNADPNWTPIDLRGEACEIGDIHFGAPPCIFEAETLRWLHEDTISDSASMRKSGSISKSTVRVVSNVFYHIGLERTPGFRR